MNRSSGWQNNRYRGTGGLGVGGTVALVLAAAALMVTAGCFLLDREEPEPDPAVPVQGSPIPAPEPEGGEEASLSAVPQGVRGIYISGPVAGDPYMDQLLALVDETELNTVVIDIKNDEGCLTYRPDSGTALEIGACVRYIGDLPALMGKLKERDIYTIARVAAFKDPVLAEARPELALRYQDGSPAKEGTAWVNPCNPAVWDYLEEVALAAVDVGFDEVQFDYVRFPTGKGMDRLDYGTTEEVVRTDIIAGFLERVTASVHERGARVSADVFGTVITNQTDAELIGQDYVRLGKIVDYICPMVYPSHYSSGTFGLDIPDREPYQTVFAAMTDSRRAFSAQGMEQEGVRAWLQDFTATWVNGHLDYGAEELRAQIQAVYDAGYTDWLLWNAKNSYTADGLLKAD